MQCHISFHVCTPGASEMIKNVNNKKGFWHSGQVHKRSVISNRLCHETHTTQERPSAYTEWSTASGTFIALPWRWRNPHEEGENLVINNSYIRHLKCSSQRKNANVLYFLSKRNYVRVIWTARERMFQNKEVAMNIWDFGTFLCDIPEPS